MSKPKTNKYGDTIISVSELFEHKDTFIDKYAVIHISDFDYNFEQIMEKGRDTVLTDMDTSLTPGYFDLAICESLEPVKQYGIQEVPGSSLITLRDKATAALQIEPTVGGRKKRKSKQRRNRITRKRKWHSRAHHNSRTKTVCPRSIKRL